MSDESSKEKGEVARGGQEYTHTEYIFQDVRCTNTYRIRQVRLDEVTFQRDPPGG